jgi:uncharacterized coiled-coil DUF342 family protein
MYKRSLIIIIGFCLILHLPVNVNALTLLDIEPPNYNTHFINLQNSYRSVNQNDLTEIPIENRPTAEVFDLFKNKIDQLEMSCQSINSQNDVSRYQQELNVLTTKIKLVETLIKDTERLESEIYNYFQTCLTSNEYEREINNINQINVSLTSVTSPFVRDSNACSIRDLITYANEFDRYRKSYENTARIMNSSVTSYNSKVDRINEIDKIVDELNEENETLGKSSTQLFQQYKLVETKLSTETQELTINLSLVSKDYDKLSNKGSYLTNVARQSVNSGIYGAMSIDNKTNWYLFENQEELLALLKLIENNKEAVSNINLSSSKISTSRARIKDLSSQRIAYEGVLTFYSYLINNNAEELKSLTLEQNELKQKIDLYRRYSLDMREEDRRLRTEIANHSKNIENCSKDTLTNLENIWTQFEKLPDDLKTEVETQFKEKYTDQDWISAASASTTLSTDPAKLVYIMNAINEVFPRFINCSENDAVSTIVNKEPQRRVSTTGISGFSVHEENNQLIGTTFSRLESEFMARNNYSYPSTENYSKYIEQNFLSRFGSNNTVNIAPKITVSTTGPWTQELITNKDTYKTYQCRSKSWSEVNTYVNYSLELGQCNSLNPAPVEIIENPLSLTTPDLIINSIKQTISANNIKIIGSCQL